MTDQIEPIRRANAVANWGRWAVRCPTLWCTNAYMPELHQAAWRCEVCGLDMDIVWPPDPIAIEALLLMRPDPNARSWEPNETLADLFAENVEHGCIPEGLAELTAGAEPVDVMTVVDGRIVGGLVYGPVEAWRAIRTSDPSITAEGEPPAYGPLPARPGLTERAAGTLLQLPEGT